MELIERVRPRALAREQVLPVAHLFVDLLPGGALRRGTALSVQGDAAVSLALRLVAEASEAGSWTAAVGLPSLGLAAAAELGVVLERLVLVPDLEPGQWGPVVAALVGAVDCLLVAPPYRLTPTAARRLGSRLRERGSVIVVVDQAHDPDAHRPGHGLPVDLSLTSRTQRWEGLGQGHGHLRARQVAVEAEGRRAAARRRHDTFWLGRPGSYGVSSQPERRSEAS